MTTPKITGDEPYYPIPQQEFLTMPYCPGITIKQKFIADYMTPMAFEGATEENIRTHSFLAEKAFQAYLKIINEE